MTDTIDQTSEDEESAPPGDAAPDAPAERSRRSRTLLIVGGLTALVGGLPLAVALGVLHSPRWYPLLDLAQTELRVRDVGNGHQIGRAHV